MQIQQAMQFHQEGKLPEAEALYRQILQIEPKQCDAWQALGVIALQRDNTQAAVALLEEAIKINPNLPVAHANIGNALMRESRFEESLRHYDRALEIQPGFAGALFNRANALMELGRPQQALASYEQSIALNPDSADVLNNCGKALLDLNRPEEALRTLERALRLFPGHALALINRASALLKLCRPEEALKSCELAIVLRPDCAEVFYNSGNALLDLKRADEALENYDRALRLRPDYAEALTNRANALLELRRPMDALVSCELALSLRPDDVDSLNIHGTCLMDLKRFEAALTSYERALQLQPNFLETLNNRAIALQELGRNSEAAICLENLLAIAPEFNYALGRRQHLLLHSCDWAKYEKHCDELSWQVSKGRRADLPFSFLSVSQRAAAQLQCARTFVAERHPSASTSLSRNRRYRHDRIRVAYLSADFRDHPVPHVMAGLIERHDPARFETIGISLQRELQPSEIGQRIQRAFAQFHDVSEMGDRDAATLMANLEIDIAVDLTGHTKAGRLGILAFRPAPVQVNYLGYPGTSGADYIDYIIADSVVIPVDREEDFAEKIARLPHSYLPTNTDTPIDAESPTRTAAGLPATGFVFCAFSNGYKIAPPVFDVWMRLLHRVPDSVLWLRDWNTTATANLRLEAAGRGIAPDRLVFAPKAAAITDHLARLKLAHLFLDTLPYNAHTTASDALFAGVPVVTCTGETFASRVAASLLHAIGLPELVTTSLEEYESLALRLAMTPAFLGDIRSTLAQNRTKFPLFDADLFRRHIETAFLMLWERHQKGDAPISFSVPPSL